MEDVKSNRKRHKTVKVTWDEIHKDFKARYPNLSKESTYWKPLEFATIEVWLKDGSKLSYSYDDKKAVFIFRKEE